MLTYNHYIQANTLEEAYELCQKKGNILLGGTLWLKMQDKNYQTAIDLCKLGLDQIIETEDAFEIGAYVSLRALEQSETLNAFTGNAFTRALKPIVGVQFRNTATLGGSIWGRFGFSDVYTLFLALQAKVELYHAGIMSLEEFATLPRTTKDILTKVIVPKNTGRIIYNDQRNTATDFPVLTCAIAETEAGIRTVIGARPHLAMVCQNGQEAAIGETLKEGRITENIAESYGESLAASLEFGSNLRAGEAYRRKICKVLVKRALLALNENESLQKGGAMA